MICPPVISMAMPRPAVISTSVAMIGWIPTTETRKPFQAPRADASSRPMPTAMSTVGDGVGLRRRVDERGRRRRGDRHHRADRQVDAAGGDDQGHPEGDEQRRRALRRMSIEAAEQVAVDDADVEEDRRSSLVDHQQDDQDDNGQNSRWRDDRLHGAASGGGDRLGALGDDAHRGRSPSCRRLSISATLCRSRITTMRWREPQHLLQLGGDEHHRHALVGQGGDESLDLGLGADVDAAGGLVEDQQLRRGEQPAGEQHLLLVAAGQVARRSPPGRSGGCRAP